jgi:adenine-specific DNA-methyltransferase
LNYIHRPGGELGEDECRGLAAILNSELLDTYFRVSSGNTQVSATELRAMPLPSLEDIKLIGRSLAGVPHDSTALEEFLKIALGASM